jgi:capsular exopolysaccharide synthesis family protein
METYDPNLPPGNTLNRFHETSARFQRYKVLLRRRWWFLLLTAAIAICYEALAISSKSVEYVAIGRIMAGMQVQLGDKTVGAQNSFVDDFYGTQIDMLQSASLQSNALERVRGLHPDLREIHVDIIVTQTKGSSILSVKGVGSEKQYTKAYVDAVLDEYMALRKRMFDNSVNGTVNRVIEEVLSRDKAVQAAKADYEKFLKEHDQTLLSDSKNAAASYLASLNNTLTVLQTEKTFMEKLGQDDYLRQKAQNGVGAEGSKVLGDNPAAEIGANTTIPGGGISRIEADWLDSQSQLRSLEAERTRLLQSYRSEHPAIKEIDNKIEAQKIRIKTLSDQASEEWARRVRNLDLRMETLRGEIAVQEVKARETNDVLVTKIQLETNYKRIADDYALWKDKLDKLNSFGLTVGEPVAILDRPAEANVNEPELWFPLLLALLLGLVAGGVILLLFDRLDDRMNSFSEFQALFPNEPILGQIPEQSNRGDVTLLRPNDDRHLYAESFRNLRSSILFKNWEAGKPPKIILVTSAVPNEGKTTTVSNMAVTMALGGARVLLVDADLRRGGVNELFKLPVEPGFSDVLNASISWRDAVRDSTTKGLHVLTRGQALNQTSELFLSPLSSEVLKEMAAEYDYVIFDSAPVLVADDTASFAPKVDTVLFVVRMSSTMARLSAKALDLLYERQVSVGGVILNRSSTNLKEYTYYNYASYYTVGAQKDKGDNKGPATA